jgi:hypothetical protein
MIELGVKKNFNKNMPQVLEFVHLNAAAVLFYYCTSTYVIVEYSVISKTVMGYAVYST